MVTSNDSLQGYKDADHKDGENDQVGAILGYKKQADSHCGLMKDSRPTSLT